MFTTLSRTLAISIGLLTTTTTFCVSATEVEQQEAAISNDRSLNVSLRALNSKIQNKYRQDDILASLDEAPGRDFVQIAGIVGDAPKMQLDFAASGFGLPITGSSSLDSSLAHFNTEVLMRGEDLFIRIARAEAGLSFTDVAGSVDANNESERTQALFSGAGDFGSLVHDDGSLNSHLLALSNLIDKFSGRERRLAFAVPVVNDAAFGRYALALTLAVE